MTTTTTVQLVGIGATFLVSCANLAYLYSRRERSSLRVRAGWVVEEDHDQFGQVTDQREVLRVTVHNRGSFDEEIVDAYLTDKSRARFDLHFSSPIVARHRQAAWAALQEDLVEEASYMGSFTGVVVKTGRSDTFNGSVRATQSTSTWSRAKRRLKARVRRALRKLHLVDRDIPKSEI